MSKNNDVLGFFIGLAMFVTGGFLFMNNVQVSSGYIFRTTLFGRNYNGIVFIPLIASVIFLFFKYNWVSKTCCILSLLLIIVNIIVNLNLRWLSTSLFATLIIFVLMFGGLGLVLRFLFSNPKGKHGKKYE